MVQVRCFLQASEDDLPYLLCFYHDMLAFRNLASLREDPADSSPPSLSSPEAAEPKFRAKGFTTIQISIPVLVLQIIWEPNVSRGPLIRIASLVSALCSSHCVTVSYVPLHAPPVHAASFLI